MASMNEQLMTQMEAMKIIRAQRRRDMQRLNGMMMKVLVSAELAPPRHALGATAQALSSTRGTHAGMPDVVQEQGCHVKSFSKRQVGTAVTALTTNPMQYEAVQVRNAR